MFDHHNANHDPARHHQHVFPRFGNDIVIDGSHAVVWVSGDVDVANSENLLGLAATAMAEPHVDEVVLDLSGVTFMDSTGLGALIGLRNQADASDKRVALRGVTPPVSKILTLTQLDTVFGLARDDAGRC